MAAVSGLPFLAGQGGAASELWVILIEGGIVGKTLQLPLLWIKKGVTLTYSVAPLFLEKFQGKDDV